MFKPHTHFLFKKILIFHVWVWFVAKGEKWRVSTSCSLSSKVEKKKEVKQTSFSAQHGGIPTTAIASLCTTHTSHRSSSWHRQPSLTHLILLFCPFILLAMLHIAYETCMWKYDDPCFKADTGKKTSWKIKEKAYCVLLLAIPSLVLFLCAVIREAGVHYYGHIKYLLGRYKELLSSQMWQVRVHSQKNIINFLFLKLSSWISLHPKSIFKTIVFPCKYSRRFWELN